LPGGAAVVIGATLTLSRLPSILFGDPASKERSSVASSVALDTLAHYIDFAALDGAKTIDHSRVSEILNDVLAPRNQGSPLRRLAQDHIAHGLGAAASQCYSHPT
jgi:hypothetical protein